MKIDKTMKIERVCWAEKGHSRDGIKNPYYDGTYLYATTGSALVALHNEQLDVDPELEKPVPGYVPLEAVKIARQGKKGQEGRLSLGGNSALIEHNQAELPRNPGQHNFPNVAQVIPTEEKLKSGKYAEILINAEFLADIQAALASKGVKILVALDENNENSSGAMLIKPLHGLNNVNSFGVLMPMRK